MIKVIRTSNVLFLLCIGVCIGGNFISIEQYLLLLVAAYGLSILANAPIRRDVLARAFRQEGCFNSGNEHYGIIHMKTITEDIERMMPEDFPYFIRDLLIQKGYKAYVASDDGKEDFYGVNVLAQKEEEVIAIHAKLLLEKDGCIEIEAVQKMIAAMKMQGAHRVMMITSRNFTQAAREQARPNKVELIDGVRLREMVRQVILTQRDHLRQPQLTECFGIGNKQYGILQKETLKLDLERLRPPAFLELIKDLLIQRGYRVKRVSDQKLGADLTAKKGKKSLAVRVQHCSDSHQSIDQEAICQAVASKAVYKMDEAMVVTNGTFTSEAMALARVNETTLVDDNCLRQLIEKNMFSMHKKK